MAIRIKHTVAVITVMLLTIHAHAQDGGTEADSQNMLYGQYVTNSSSINSGNVSSMKLSWKYPTEFPVSHAPLVKDNAVYFGDWGGTIYKVDSNTGKLVWKKKIEKPNKKWPWHGFAGTGTLGDDKLFEASTEGNAFALDPESGKVLWKTDFTDDPQAGSISTLLYHDGLVYIGVSSVEEMVPKLKKLYKNFKPDFQGKVVALDAQNGKVMWEKMLVQSPHNGAPVWTPLSLDPETSTLYFTTGNNYTGEASKLSDSVIAVDAKTGEVKWSKQLTSFDVWTMTDQEGPDYDFSGGPQLFEAEVDGQTQKLVGAAQKSGIYHVLDAQTGDVVWQTTIGYGGIEGGMHGEASIDEQTILLWSNNNYMHSKSPKTSMITVKALDASTGQPKWVINKAQPAAIVTGHLTNNVYFIGSLDGTLQAYDVKSGKQLWSVQNPSPVISTPQIEENTLYFGGGVPDIFTKWANEKEHGLYAYSVE